MLILYEKGKGIGPDPVYPCWHRNEQRILCVEWGLKKVNSQA